MRLLNVFILAVVQGLAELLPVSSSAHVVVAEKLMGIDPSKPEMTLLLVMLHTGTMAAVIVYFWKRWQKAYFGSFEVFRKSAFHLLVASAATAVIGELLIKGIERVWLHNAPNGEVEQLFSHLELIAPALALVGILILISGIFERRLLPATEGGHCAVKISQAGIIGTIQGVCLPFRGLSRSGATISTGILAGVPKMQAEEFSFALAVILTPAADARELLRLARSEHVNGVTNLSALVMPSLFGAFLAFLAGLIALKWLSRWLENGSWYLFGVYCLIAALAVAVLHHIGF